MAAILCGMYCPDFAIFGYKAPAAEKPRTTPRCDHVEGGDDAR